MSLQAPHKRRLISVITLGIFLSGISIVVLQDLLQHTPSPALTINEKYPVIWPMEQSTSELKQRSEKKITPRKEPTQNGLWLFNHEPTKNLRHRIGQLAFTYTGHDPVKVALRLNNKRFPFDLNRTVETIEKAHSSHQDRAVAAFRWVSENYTNLVPPTGGGFPDHNPQIFTNSFRYGYCDDAAEHLAQLHAALGIPSQVVGLGGHVIVQSEIDGRPVLFDPDFKLIYWNENRTSLLSREEVCASENHHLLGDSVVNTVYRKTRVQELASILCEHDGNQGIVPARYRKGSPIGAPLFFSIQPGTRVQFFPTKRLARMAVVPPPGQDNAHVGYMRMDTPLNLSSSYTAHIERSFALPLLSASLQLQTNSQHPFEVHALVTTPDGVELRSRQTKIANGKTETVIPILELSDLAPYEQITQIEFKLKILAHPGPDPIEMAGVLATSHQLATDAFPSIEPGENTLVLENKNGEPLDELAWSLSLEGLPVAVLTAPHSLKTKRPTNETIHLSWEDDPASNPIYDVELVNQQAPNDFIFPVLAAGLTNPFLTIEGSAMAKFLKGQSYQWRVRKRDRSGQVSSFSPWEQLTLTQVH